MVTLHETEVDGVRCFWVESGRPTLAALLAFRQGQVDEPITEQGFQHVLEHLALNGRGAGSLHVNGQVGLLETVFQSHGPADLVATHLEDLTGWLADPQLDALDKERRILQAEAATRGGSVVSRALGWRYGATGPGIGVYDDVGLGRATVEALRQRAAAVFTQGNAVLVLDGPPPADLTLRLPPGALLAVPRAVPCEDEYPAMYVDEAGLCLSGVVSRSASAIIASELLRKELEDQFRHQDGHAYSPGATYERLDAATALVMAATDISTEAHPTLLNRALTLMRRLRATRPDADRVIDLRDSQIQAMTDPYAVVGIATRAGIDTLTGRPVASMEDMIDEVRSVTPAQVVEAFEAIHSTLLVGIPGATIYAGEIPRLEAPTNRPRVTGASFRSLNWPGDRSRLRIGPGGFEIGEGDVARTIEPEAVHALFVYENGLRHVVTSDGYGLTLNPHVWRNGSRAVTLLDELVPAHRHLPLPAVKGIDNNTRTGFVKRWTAPLRRRLHVRGTLVLLLVVASLVAWIAGVALFIYVDALPLSILWGILVGSWTYGLLSGNPDD